MKKFILFSLLVLMSSSLFSKPQHSSRELIVRFEQHVSIKDGKTGIEMFDHLMNKYGVENYRPIIENEALKIYNFTFEKKLDFNAIEDNLKNSDDIIYIQPNYLNEMLSITPNDQYFYKQWGLLAVNANNAWEIEKGNEQIIIAIIDSGIEYDHPDLEQNIWINYNEIPDNFIDDDNNGYVDDWMGWDFTETNIVDAMGDFRERDNDPRDDLGHGTHIAGILAAQTNNHTGVAGTTWFTKCMNLRAGFRTTIGGYLEDDDVSAAIVYAAENGAQIISISWGDAVMAPIIKDACNYAYGLGVTIIASAGNEGGVGLLYPAALENVLSVTAVDEDLNICSFSSYGEGVDMSGPGLSIFSTYLNEDYKEESGTSMAAPFVAGCAGLLLAQNPLLQNDEVYDLLRLSCDDLGDDGYDNIFGYGIINAEKLMQNANLGLQLQSSIFFPSYNSGHIADIPIVGTAYCDDFFCYTLSYTTKQTPVENDWCDVVTHNPEPTLYTTPITNDTLGTFSIQSLQDTTYYIRLSVKDIHGNFFNDIVKVSLDRSAPSFIPNATAATHRYNFDKKDYYILSTADEPVQFYAFCEAANQDSFTLIQKKYDHYTALKLPDYLPEEIYSYYLTIKNPAGLSTTSQFYQDAITIDNSTIPTRGFDVFASYPRSGYLCPNSYDINGNGKTEVIFMEFPDEGTYGTVYFCEYNGLDLEVVHQMDKGMIPWSIGDSDADGTYEIMCNAADSMLIYESNTPGTFPSEYVNAIKDAYSGTFYDFNNDGKDDVIIRSSDIIGTYSHYNVYSRNGDNFSLECMILNNTHTTSRNELSPHIRFGDLTGDGIRNLMFSDIDGDILIYNINNNYSVQLIDSLKIPIPNAYYNAVGDLDGDGTLEFVVGGYADDTDEVNNQFWLYGIYKYIEGVPTLLDYIEIAGVSSRNGLTVGDLDNDGADELVIATAPDIYIFKLQQDTESYSINPLWVGESYRTYYPVCSDLNNDGYYEAIFNQYDADDSLRIVCAQFPATPSTVPMAENFHGFPLNDHEVYLNWKACPSADNYILYKHYSGFYDIIQLPNTITSYTDTSVIADTLHTYELAIAQDAGEGYPTLPLEIVPTNPPALSSVEMSSLNSFTLNFDKTLHKECESAEHYYMDSYGYPESVIPTNSQMSLLLTFADTFHEDDAPYTLQVAGIKGVYSAPMPDTVITCDYKEDITRPYIIAGNLETDTQVFIDFNETVNQISASTNENYTLLFPENAGIITISNILVQNARVILTLSKSIKPVGTPYFIKVNNVEDLAGNVILPGKNLIKIMIPITNLDDVTVFPNPATIEQELVYFQNLPTEGTAEFFIYDLEGTLIREFVAESLSQDYNFAQWDMKNQSGKKIASGMYFYLIKYLDNYKKGKIAIIR